MTPPRTLRTRVIHEVMWKIIVQCKCGCNTESRNKRPFWATVTSNGSPYVTRPLSCLSCLTACNVGVLWPNGCMDHDATWHGGRPRLRRHCVRWGSAYPRKGAQQPLKIAVLCQMVTQLPPPLIGHSSPHFSAHAYCGQTVAHFSNC